MQKHCGFKERVVGCANGRLSKQVEQTVAEEDGLLSGDFPNSRGCKAINSNADFLLDMVSQRNFRAHLRLLSILSRCWVLTTAERRPVLFPLRISIGHKAAAFTLPHVILFGEGKGHGMAPRTKRSISKLYERLSSR